jgi:hypothetical protein
MFLRKCECTFLHKYTRLHFGVAGVLGATTFRLHVWTILETWKESGTTQGVVVQRKGYTSLGCAG